MGIVISTHAPLAGRDLKVGCLWDGLDISTHAPLAGRDAGLSGSAIMVDISTHAPLAGRDRSFVFIWRAQHDFNPRAPCGARQARA